LSFKLSPTGRVKQGLILARLLGGSTGKHQIKFDVLPLEHRKSFIN